MKNYDAAKEYIKSFDLNPIIDRLVYINGWKRRHALHAVRQYRKFLWLLVKYGDTQKISPSLDIDEVWHSHILHTEKYHDDCQHIFGKYIHHRPEEKTTEASLQQNDVLQELFQCEFGEVLYEVVPSTKWAKVKEKLFYFSLRYIVRKFKTRKELLKEIY